MAFSTDGYVLNCILHYGKIQFQPGTQPPDSMGERMFEEMLQAGTIVPVGLFGHGKGLKVPAAGEKENPADKGYGGQEQPAKGPGKPLPDQRAIAAEVLADIRERAGGDEEVYTNELNILAAEQGYNGPVLTAVEAEVYLSKNADKTAQAD